MNKPKKFEDCFENVSEAITAANWATICRIIGWIILVICFIVGIVLAADAYVGGFAIFLGCSIGGFIVAATFWILGAILDALASSAQSNAETARMTYWHLYADIKTTNQKNLQKKQNKKAPGEESSLQKDTAINEPLNNFETEDTNTIWTCTNCGVENEPWDNVCNYCGQKKVE